MSIPADQASAVAPPQPMPFAIMRNSHEALRASIRVQEQWLETGDLGAFTDEWHRLGKALVVHMAMEDKFMFGLLDEVSGGAIAQAALPGEHVIDLELAKEVDAALAGGLEAVRTAWSTWRQDHLHHLEHEEQVMMPLTMKTGATSEARARVVHDRLLTPSQAIADFDWYVGWVVHMLSEHGTTAQPANVAVRVFAWGLQHACSREQWNHFRPLVMAQCSPAIWAELVKSFGLDGDGTIREPLA
jgi:hypothetical protein